MSVAWLSSALFTYLAHGLVWAALGLCCGQLASASAYWQHACYKAAFLGPFLSATLALALPVGAVPDTGVLAQGAWLRGVTAAPNDARWLVGGQVLGALVVVGALRFALVARGRWASLRGRALVTERAALRLLEQVRGRSTLKVARLTYGPGLRSPLVVGRNEICVPRWLTSALDKKQLAAVFAHELSHLERGDGHWFAFAGFIESCLWFQPLNRLLGARFRASAELACDERALSLGVDARALAQALVRVAEHGIGLSERQATPWPAMARSRDDVSWRIQRLLGHQELAGALPARWAFPLLLAGGLVQSAFGVHVPGLPLPVQRSSPAELATLSREMVVLGREQARVEQELEVVSATTPSPQASPRVLELEQELRHLIQQRVYVEERAAAGAPRR